jgi:outer membrane lipoprotein-sorting protein
VDAVVNLLRRLPLSRLLLLCVLVVAIGVSATAIAFALSSGATPPPKPLAQAIHDALGAGRLEGASASVTLTDNLLEGASLASGGHSSELTSNPLITGGSGRLWVAKDGRLRLELQSQQGDTQILYDGHTISIYDAATNTLYRYTPKDEGGSSSDTPMSDEHEVPSVAKIEEALTHLSKHADISGATPTDVGGQPAYTVRLSPEESGSLFGGVELSFDANHGVPLRAAVYSSTASTPVIELAATEISYGPVADSVFEVNPPANAKLEEIVPPSGATHSEHTPAAQEEPKLTTRGHGPSTIAIVEGKAKASSKRPTEALEGLPKVKISGVSASELRTALGTLLTFERSGVRYLLAGSVTPGAIEAVARGL